MSSIDTNALFKIEYGLYVVTLKGEELDRVKEKGTYSGGNSPKSAKTLFNQLGI